MKISRNSILNLIVLGGFILFVFIKFMVDIKNYNRITKNLQKEYPAITLDQVFNGFITNIRKVSERSIDNPASACLSVNDTLKRRFYAKNVIKEGKQFDEVIQVGDQIKKEAGSDSLIIIKILKLDTIRHVFRLHDDFGNLISIKNK